MRAFALAVLLGLAAAFAQTTATPPDAFDAAAPGADLNVRATAEPANCWEWCG